MTEKTNEPQEHISVRDAMILTGVSEKTIYRWCRTGKIKAVFMKGIGKWQINRQSLLHFKEYGPHENERTD